MSLNTWLFHRCVHWGRCCQNNCSFLLSLHWFNWPGSVYLLSQMTNVHTFLQIWLLSLSESHPHSISVHFCRNFVYLCYLHVGHLWQTNTLWWILNFIHLLSFVHNAYMWALVPWHRCEERTTLLNQSSLFTVQFWKKKNSGFKACIIFHISILLAFIFILEPNYIGFRSCLWKAVFSITL